MSQKQPYSPDWLIATSGLQCISDVYFVKLENVCARPLYTLHETNQVYGATEKQGGERCEGEQHPYIKQFKPQIVFLQAPSLSATAASLRK